MLWFQAIIVNPQAPSLIAVHPGGTAPHPDDKMSAHLLNPDEPVSALFERLKANSLRRNFALVDLRDIVERIAAMLCIEFISKEIRQL